MTDAVMDQQDQPIAPRLPDHVDMWTVRSLALFLSVPEHVVRHHARRFIKTRNGRYRMTLSEAQKVANLVITYKRRPKKSPQPSTAPEPQNSPQQ